MKKKLIAVMLINISVMGCATLSKEECLKGEWRVIGYKDGVKGYQMERLEEHEEACKEYGIKPEITYYQAGLSYYGAASVLSSKY